MVYISHVTVVSTILKVPFNRVGGFNPPEKYESQYIMEDKKMFETNQ